MACVLSGCRYCFTPAVKQKAWSRDNICMMVSKINIKADPELSRSKTRALKSEMNELLRPKPNGSFLGIKC